MSSTAPELAPIWADSIPSWIVGVRPGNRTAEPEIVEAPGGAPEIARIDSCLAAFDGVLFNDDELRRAFPRRGGEDTDAALVLRVYLEGGERFAEQLNGRFSLVIWDGRTGEALGVRDRMGLVPLFYAQAGESVLFSNSIDTLIGHPAVPETVNRRLLALHVWPAWWIEEKDETYLEAVKRVVAGTVLRFRPDGRESRRYWNPAPLGEEVDWIDDDEAMERFVATLSQAVERGLRRGPATICLSGGLDSISIASYAVEIAEREGWATPQALSVEFPDPDNLGEADVQRLVAKRLGMPQLMLPLEEALGGRALLPLALEVSRTWPVPLLGIFSPAYSMLIDEAKSRGTQVVMTGAGGDNWLAVTLDYAADRIARLDFVAVWRLWYMMQRSYRVPRVFLLRKILWKYGLRNVLASLEQRALSRVAPGILRRQTTASAERSMPPWLAPDPVLREELLELAVAKRMELKPKPGDFYTNEIRRGLDHPIQAVDLEESFEKGRRMGVEIWMPYFDPDLVDLLCRIHPRVLTKGNRSKSLVREAMASRVAGLGIERQKKITTGNFWPKKLEEATDVWNGLGGVQGLGQLGVVDADLLDAKVKKMLAEGQKAAVPFIWEILDHEAWVRARL
jgi:asparagine synthetase B (glutamine-hydrolysing)